MSGADPSIDNPRAGNSAPHEEDFGCRAPLAPRLARELKNTGACAMSKTKRLVTSSQGAIVSPQSERVWSFQEVWKFPIFSFKISLLVLSF